MKKYIRLENDVVAEILNEYEEIFGDIHISKRYTKEFINTCVVVDEDVKVEVNWKYENGKFIEPKPVIIDREENKKNIQDQINALENELLLSEGVI
jgi:2-phospho-L-lactate transferase/gluconeogenesis factor (CofD/UPF0052 family)